MSNRVRLQLDDYGDGNDGQLVRSTQAILDFTTGSLEPHDNSMEWMPTILGYDESTATGSLNVSTSTATLSWRPHHGAPTAGNASFVLPNATRAVWWFSASFGRVFFVYHLSTSQSRVASCSTVDGTCSHGPAPSLSYLEPGTAMVWDSEHLVGLPLMCCVCRSHDYYRFNVAAGGLLPSLTEMPALNTLGPTFYDVSADEVWGVSGLTVTRYDYAAHESAALTLPAASLKALIDAERPMPGWAIALISLGVVAALCLVGGWVLLAAGWCKPRGKKKATEIATPEHVLADSVACGVVGTPVTKL